MNNIEILEKLVERCKECKFACCEQCEINNTQVRAIENLIKENKELKEGQIETLDKILQPQLLKKYVSKNKIKEKIEYLKSLEFGTDLVTQSTANLTTICILQELLEEGE